MPEVDFKFDRGEEVKEVITGFTGIVIGRTEWLNGCKRYGVKPRELKDGKPIQEEWFDEQQLEPTGDQLRLPGEKKIEETKKGKLPPGGPQRDPRY